MAIYLRGKSYYYDFVYKGHRYGGCIGPVSRTMAKEEEARKKAEVIEGRLNPAKVRKKNPTFAAFADAYLDWLKTNKTPGTYKRMVFILKHAREFFGHKRILDITEWHIEQYKKLRREAPCKPATVNLELTMLKAMLNNKTLEGNRRGTNPVDEVKKLSGVKGKIRFLSEEEEAAILPVCSPELQRVVEVGLLTGFRRQELVRLRPEDIDYARGEVTVTASSAKNGKSRPLPLTARLRAVLEEAVAARGDAATVFVTKAGKPWSLNALSHAFGRACLRAGLERLGPHVMRHTFASRLVMAGVDLRTVQELMGHSSITMTMRYAHSSPDHTRAALETLENRYPGEKSPINFHNTPPADLPQQPAKVVAIR